MHEHIKKGFAFFQETHSVENDYVSWKTEWDGDILLNNGSSNSRGTMIAFTKTFEYQQLNMHPTLKVEFNFAQSCITMKNCFL